MTAITPKAESSENRRQLTQFQLKVIAASLLGLLLVLLLAGGVIVATSQPGEISYAEESFVLL